MRAALAGHVAMGSPTLFEGALHMKRCMDLILVVVHSKH